MSIDVAALEMLLGAEEEDMEIFGVVICRSTCDGTWNIRV